MQYFQYFIFIILLISGCNKMEVITIEYVPTTGETVTITAPIRDADSVKHTYEMFPNEIYYGDTVYLVCYDTNISDNTIPGFADIKDTNIISPCSVTISSDTLQSQYNWIGEYCSSVWDDRGLDTRNFIPGEKRLGCKYYLEFPPLEDWNVPFWKEMREKITPEGVRCKLSITLLYHRRPGESWTVEWVESATTVVTQEILVKPRLENEMTLLEQWYKNTPEKLFPKVDRSRKIPHDDYWGLISSGRSNIKIGWSSYDPWLFIRIGNRKPSDPNNPTTLDGWRELEASLVPSTMRDEVRLTRLQLEYYSATKGEASENAKKELADWLKSLPDPQRIVMTTFLVSKMYDFFQTSLRDKNRELIRALYDILDYGCQESVCNFESINYKDSTLTPPQGVRVQRSFMEIVEPTAEDLALNSKELPDGFRIWDAVGDVGPTRLVARFVELKEDEDTAILRNRDGLSFNLIFSTLSEEDKQYAREQHAKKLTENESE